MDLNETKICRTCLIEEGTFKSIFKEETSSVLTMPISEIINTCTNIQVNQGDELPEQICTKCLKLAVKTYFFKLTCEKSDSILRAKLTKVPSRHEVDFRQEVKVEIPKPLIKTEIVAQSESFIAEFSSESNEKISVKKEELEICYEDLKNIEKIQEEYSNNFCQDDSIKMVESYRTSIKNELKISKKISDNIEIPLINKSNECLLECEKKENKAFCNEKTNKNEKNRAGAFRKKQKTIETENTETDLSAPKGKMASICTICNRSFTTLGSLGNHKKTHTGEKPYKCNVCQKTFSQSKYLLVHNRIHTGEKPYKCNVCPKTFLRSRDSLAHERIHTGEKPHMCNECPKTYLRSKDLAFHKRIHTGEKLYRCNVCPKTFSRSRDILVHGRIHTGEKPYECDVCDKKFSTSGNLVNHKLIHTGEKPYECDVCDKKFRRSAHLVRHKIIHTGKRPYECDVCRKTFSQSVGLEYHKKIHTGEKPHECDVCDRHFRLSGNLLRHKRIHTGEKLCKCNVCERTFLRLGDLLNHERIHTGEKP